MVDASARISAHHLDQLPRACGEVITPGDAGYDEARRLWNAIHDRRPAVIVRPTQAEEVAAAVRIARDHDLEITVRSGGHSASGLAGENGGLCVDMSAIRGVESIQGPGSPARTAARCSVSSTSRPRRAVLSARPASSVTRASPG